MACMEHSCSRCNFATFNNESGGPYSCPKCGAELRHYFDEPVERGPRRRFDEPEEVGEKDLRELGLIAPETKASAA